LSEVLPYKFPAGVRRVGVGCALAAQLATEGCAATIVSRSEDFVLVIVIIIVIDLSEHEHDYDQEHEGSLIATAAVRNTPLESVFRRTVPYGQEYKREKNCR